MKNLDNCIHTSVEHKCEYSSFGWFLFTFLGMSAKPLRVDFICNDCGSTVRSEDNPTELKKFIGR